MSGARCRCCSRCRAGRGPCLAPCPRCRARPCYRPHEVIISYKDQRLWQTVTAPCRRPHRAGCRYPVVCRTRRRRRPPSTGCQRWWARTPRWARRARRARQQQCARRCATCCNSLAMDFLSWIKSYPCSSKSWMLRNDSHRYVSERHKNPGQVDLDNKIKSCLRTFISVTYILSGGEIFTSEL